MPSQSYVMPRFVEQSWSVFEFEDNQHLQSRLISNNSGSLKYMRRDLRRIGVSVRR